MTSSDNEDREVHGTVKWFDIAKGFGFVVPDGGGKDILLHANVLGNFGRSSIADGSQIVILTQKTDRGDQASEVVGITPPEGVNTTATDYVGVDVAVLTTLPWVAARVKWFDRAKGFGFVNVFGNSNDVFLHSEVLKAGGFSCVQPGEAISIKVIDGPRGPIAATIFTWDFTHEASGDAVREIA